MTSSKIVSVRLPEETRKLLDKAAKKTRRSRSYLMKEALEYHLRQIVTEEQKTIRRQGMDRLLAMAGAGRAHVGEQPAEDIEKRIREFRGDE